MTKPDSRTDTPKAMDALEDVIDQLLPVPEEPARQEHVNDAIDVVVPKPGQEPGTFDDASTREELEVDTSTDGIDDIIPVQ